MHRSATTSHPKLKTPAICWKLFHQLSWVPPALSLAQYLASSRYLIHFCCWKNHSTALQSVWIIAPFAKMRMLKFRAGQGRTSTRIQLGSTPQGTFLRTGSEGSRHPEGMVTPYLPPVLSLITCPGQALRDCGWTADVHPPISLKWERPHSPHKEGTIAQRPGQARTSQSLAVSSRRASTPSCWHIRHPWWHLPSRTLPGIGGVQWILAPEGTSTK
jgi:hypothetical protein